jgi:hypothetical protein
MHKATMLTCWHFDLSVVGISNRALFYEREREYCTAARPNLVTDPTVLCV